MASFTGFALALNPVVAIIVVIDEPSGQHMGGEVAAPVFKKVAEPILRYMSVPPDAPSYAPHYTVQQGPERTREPMLKPDSSSAAGVFAPKFVVADFNPSSAGSVLEFGEIVVPDFNGKSLRQVTQECLRAGLRLQSIGSGAAIRQTPPPGTTVPVGAGIQVRFSTRLSQR